MKKETIKKILKEKKWIVNGIDIPLTDEQLKQFESLIEKPRHKMSKPTLLQKYYIIDYHSDKGYFVREFTWENEEIDIRYFENGNCYLDKELATQVAMDLNLIDRLRKFSYENGWKDKYLLDANKEKFKLIFICEEDERKWFAVNQFTYISPMDVYFVSREVTVDAIKEIVEPFCKENPTYRFNIKGE